MREEDPFLGENDKEAPEKYRTYFSVILGVVELGFLVAASVVLLTTEEDCDRPVRLWLKVLVGVLGFHSVFLLCAELLADRTSPGFGAAYIAINSILQSFLFLWMLMGTVWVFDEPNSCREDFEEGYLVTVVMLSIYYGLLGLLLLSCVLLFCVTCFGSWRILNLIKE